MELYFEKNIMVWIMPATIDALILGICPCVSSNFQIKPLLLELTMYLPRPVVVAVLVEYERVANPVVDFMGQLIR